MLNIIKTAARITVKYPHFQRRTFLSQAYYCREVWDRRFTDPIIQKVRIDEMYNELDQKYNKFKNISAVDVDIFANAITDISYVDELLDVIHKLRLSADTGNTLNSTLHAVIRNLSDFGKTNELLMALDDRLNYGLFLDNFSANLLLDTFWKNKDYVSGSRIAGQLMLQEEVEHPLCAALSLLHCYNYLLSPTEWPLPPLPEEPEDEVKIRVKYVRNPYDDRHFDLRDPLQIIGKTIKMITSGKKDTLDKSLHLLGVALFEDNTATENLILRLVQNKEVIYEDILKLIQKDLDIKAITTQQGDVQNLLQDRVKTTVEQTVEKDIALQCDIYMQWEKERQLALERQIKRALTAKRLANVQDMQEKLKEKETLLWFFDNEDKIDLQIDEKDAILADVSQQQKMPIKTEEVYIPPEADKRRQEIE